uniref:Uncharacterized protein n=1 Tax=Timema cristinae TaxID=61476 RepID=A0A7R9D779_TIMCR|nr:unnamed protein product [Timema cristinae]
MLSVFDTCGIFLPEAIPTSPGRVSTCHFDLAKFPKATTPNFVYERTFYELLSTHFHGFNRIYTDGSKFGAPMNTQLIPQMILGNTLSVDTFLVISGLLVSYVFFNKLKNGTISSFRVLPYYIHRYCRDDPIGITERESVPITAPELEDGGGIYSFNNVVYTSPYYIFLTAVTLMNDIDMASMNLPVEPLYGDVRLLVCTPVTTVRDDTDGILLKMTSVVNQHGCSSDCTHLSERIHLRFFHKHVS